MFLKLIIASIISLLLTSCVSNNFHYDMKNSSLSFPLENLNKKVFLTDVKYENTFSGCSVDTYILSCKSKEYGNFFIENIELANNCQWNGAANGFFTYELKTRLKFKTFKLVDRFTKQNYEISTYKVDGEKYVSIIERYTVNGNILIIDNRGKLSAEIIKTLDPEFEYKYLNEQRTDIKYDYSLVKNNVFFRYFGKEVEVLDRK
ncbi:MAG: hypothetical protein C0626_08350 [Arcobacter sp.]|nr:MAG: hypothetical protein C0626_08350 [Arcobacter sp.]